MDKAHSIETMFMSTKVVIAARISCVEDLTVEKTEEGFESYPIYIISQETSSSGKLHQHLFVAAENLTTDIVTSILKGIYPDAKGNKCLYVKKALKPKQLLKYTLKEGDYVSKGISDALLKDASILSKSKEKMKDKFTELEEQLILKHIRFPKFVEDYIRLKVVHGQNMYDNHLIAYFKRLALSVGEIQYDEYVDFLMAKILPN